MTDLPHRRADPSAEASPDHSADGFRRRAAMRLAQDPAGVYDLTPHGDHELNPGIPLDPDAPALRDAAVLVPIVDRGDEAAVILTLRTAHLPSHAGQIAFPGGKIDPVDPTPGAAALREAEEEIGLDRGHVDLLGYAPPYHTRSGFRILPVVGLVDPRFTPNPNPGEVADVFEVPLGFLMDPANHRIGARHAPTGTRFFYEMPFEHRHIWGVTAGIIRRLYERIYL